MQLCRNILAGIVSTALVLGGFAASAAVESGVEFADTALVQGAGRSEPLELCSTGLLRYRVVFKGYAAGFYRDDCDRSGDGLADAPMRLELSYFWTIDGRFFGEAAEQQLRESLDGEAFAALESRLERLHATYRTVEPGDRYALTYIPGRGTELALNSRSLAFIDGRDFARAYFGIWLGENPIDEKLRNDLLARTARD